MFLRSDVDYALNKTMKFRVNKQRKRSQPKNTWKTQLEKNVKKCWIEERKRCDSLWHLQKKHE